MSQSAGGAVYDPPDYQQNRTGGSKMNKTSINKLAAHVAVAALIVWGVTKFV